MSGKVAFVWPLVALTIFGWRSAVVYGEPPVDQKGESSAHSEISADVLRKHVEFLADPKLEGRGTPRGKQLARSYLRKQFQDMRLEPLFGKSEFVQEIPGPVGRKGEKTVAGWNMGAWLPGNDPQLKDEFVIVSAHYDHLGIDREGNIYTGADDNAGSVAMVLEVARQLTRAKVHPQRSVVFLFCDLEENMLFGSRWFVGHPPWPIDQVKLFITSEMIGRTLGDLPVKTIFVMGAERGSGLRDLVNRFPIPAELEIAHLGIDVVGTRSDYGPFQTEKIPFLFFSGGEHPDYHTPRDTADRLDYERVANVSRLIFQICRSAADADEAPKWVERPTYELGEIRSLHDIAELLLKLDDEAEAGRRFKLSALQRVTVSGLQQKTSQILDRGQVLPEERPGIVRSAQLLLLTVF